MINQNRRDIAAKQKADKEHRDEMARISNMDRKAKGQEPVKASVPNKLNFGANMVKFEPPKDTGGWGWARFKEYRC